MERQDSAAKNCTAGKHEIEDQYIKTQADAKYVLRNSVRWFLTAERYHDEDCRVLLGQDGSGTRPHSTFSSTYDRAAAASNKFRKPSFFSGGKNDASNELRASSRKCSSVKPKCCWAI